MVDSGDKVADAIKIYASGSDAATTLNLTSAGTGADAIDINSSGGVDIDAADDITIDTTDTSEGIKIGTVTSGVPITIGHTTSEVTVGENLNVDGDLDVTGALSSSSYEPDVINITHATDPKLIIYNTEQSDGDTDRHGKLIFKGVQNNSTVHQLASIISQHDGTGANKKGETVFYINDGADTDDNLSEWLRGDSSLQATFAGDVALASTKKLYLDGGSNTYIHQESADTIDVVCGGTTVARFDHEAGLHIGFTAQPSLETKKAIGFGDNEDDPDMAGAAAAYIYAKDVTGTVELFGIDEAGNASQLTPHNFSLFERPDPMAWSYYCKNKKDGYELNVDMWGAIKAIEEMTGKKFIHSKEI